MFLDKDPKSLEDVCTLITDGSHFSPTPQAEGFPIVNAKDIPHGRINLETCTRISREDWKRLKRQNCAPIRGDILLSKDGTIGRVVLYDNNLGVVALSSIAIIRPADFIDSGFLSFLLRSEDFSRQLRVIESGSALRRIVLKDIKQLKFSFPSLKQEQSKIAEILSTVDQAIEQTEGLIAKQQRIKTGLMQDLLTHGIDEHGNLRSEETHEFKDSPLGRIPVEWVDDQLGNTVLQIKRGPSLSTNNEMRGIIYLTSDNISDSGELIWPIIKYLDLRISNLNSILDIGDVILNCVNSEAQIGKVGFVDQLPDITTTGFNNFALSFDSELLLPKFAFYMLSSEPFQRALRKKIKPAINQSSFSASDIADLPVVCPKKEEQLSIITIVDGISKASHKSQKTLAKLNKIKTALMQDLLTGKVRVTPLLKKTEKAI